MKTTTRTARPVYAVGFFGGRADVLRAASGKPATIGEIIATCADPSSPVGAVVLGEDGAPLGYVDPSGAWWDAVDGDRATFGAPVLLCDSGRWQHTSCSGRGHALGDLAAVVCDTCIGQTHARPADVRLLVRGSVA